MTKKDFFILVIKLFGMYLFLGTCFTLFPTMMTDIVSMFGLYMTVLLSIATLIFTFGLVLLLILKAPWIVEKMHLDKGFEEDRIIMNNVKARDIVKIGSFIIGGLLIINNLPDFLTHSVHAFTDKINPSRLTLVPKTNKIEWLMSALNIILGYILLTRFEWVGKLLKTDQTTSNEE